MTFVLAMLGLGLLAVIAVAWPMWRKQRPLEAGLAALLVAGLGAGVYLLLGRPDLVLSPPVPPQQAQVQQIEAAIEQLASRLEDNPDDPQGWTMLGRSYVLMGRYDEGAQAFVQAQAYTTGEDADLLASFAEARALADPAALSGEVGTLFERVLSLDPTNPRGLWYGGLAAQSRGDAALARSRWQALLQTDLPEKFRQVVEERLQTVGVAAAGAEPLLDIKVSVAEALAPEMPEGGVLYVFVRMAEGGAGGPPIAATRTDNPELPLELRLTTADLLMQESLPAGRLRVTARWSRDSEPQAAPGDLEGDVLWERADGNGVQLVLDRRVTE